MAEKIAIIGGGISGLCSALALQNKGFEVTVYEKGEDRPAEGAGIILGRNALQALEMLNIGMDICQAGKTGEDFTIYSEFGEPLACLCPAHHSNMAAFLFIQPERFYEILLRYINPGTIQYEKELTGFADQKNDVRLFFKDGTEASADYLLACDGKDSLLRSLLFPDSEPRFSGYTVWRGMMDGKNHNLRYSETWGSRGRFGIVPLPDNKIYWYAVKKQDEHLPDTDQWHSIDLLFNFFYYPEPIQRILENTAEEDIFRHDLFEFQPPGQYLTSKVLLIGDAAHPIPPELGQGASMAIEEAATLAKWARSGIPLKDILHKYENERLKRNRQLSKEIHLFRKAATIDKPVFCSIRNACLKLLPGSFHENKLDLLFNQK